MTRRAILQIGTEKTGTTTLQHFLASNRARLADRGLLYPRFCGELNHTGLAAYALDPDKEDELRHPFGACEAAQIEPMRDRLRRAAGAELAGASTVILCNEHCHSRLNRPSEIARLRDFLGAFFDDVRICVYLRRQDQVALSLYSTRLKSGGTGADILPRTGSQDPYFNYERSLALWAEAFGREAMHVRLFDRRSLAGGSIVSDFLAAWGLGAPASYQAVTDQNESITPVAQAYLRLLNGALKPLPQLPLEAVRGPIAQSLARHFPGRGARPARAAAQAFYAQYRASNEAVRRDYFPDRAQLFDEDFSGYPEADELAEIGPEALAAVAARLQTAQLGEIRRLEAEIAMRDAHLHWSRDEQAATLQALARARSWRPDHAAVHRTTAEYLYKLGRHDEALAAAGRAVELRDGSAEYWHFLGVLRRQAGDPEGAAAAQARVLQIDPAHAAARRELDQLARLRAAPPIQPRKDQTWPRPISA